MRPYLLRTIAVAMAVIGMAGCKLHLTQELYTADIVDVVTGDASDVYAPMSMKIPIQDADECTESKATVNRVVAGVGLVGFTPRQCEKVRFTNYLIADLRVPVEVVQDGEVDFQSAFNVWVDQRSDGIEVFLVVDRSALDLLESRIADEFPYTDVDLSESTVRLVLNNDLRETVSFSVGGVFLDEEPVHGSRSYELPRRGATRIRLSDVSVAALMEGPGIGVLVVGSTIEGRAAQ